MYIPDIKIRVLKTSIVTDNPYIFIQDITTIKIGFPKSKKFGIGIFTGYGISSGGLSPVIGIGINYNVFSFLSFVFPFYLVYL